MRLRKYWKRTSCCMLAGMLSMAVLGCGQRKDEYGGGQSMDDSAMEDMSTQISVPVEEETENPAILEENIEECIKEGVVLPENCETMLFPLEALAVEYYAQNYPYYMEGEIEDSFWFSMAVLSSLMSENGYTHPEYKEEYNMFSREELDVYANALYASYASGDMALPPFQEDSSYAYYDEESARYGLLVGNVGDLGIFITDCQQESDGYEIRFQLMNQESNTVITEFQSTICLQGNDSNDTLFHASVCKFTELNEVINDGKSDTKEDESDQEDYLEKNVMTPPGLENDGKKKSFESENSKDEILEDESEENKEETEEILEDDRMIDRSEALKLAQTYLGAGVTCSYKQLLTVGDCQYYDFAIKGEGISFTDVLVRSNGLDIFRGIQNSDGSWTFEF